MIKRLIEKIRAWFLQVFRGEETIVVPWKSEPGESKAYKPTKAYADQRQKAARNRRKKPTKAMRNLYKL